jgi:hypothetical protein
MFSRHPLINSFCSVQQLMILLTCSLILNKLERTGGRLLFSWEKTAAESQRSWRRLRLPMDLTRRAGQGTITFPQRTRTVNCVMRSGSCGIRQSPDGDIS